MRKLPIIFVAVLLVGCDARVDRKSIDLAMSVCEPHGGVEYARSTEYRSHTRVTAGCKDQTRFEKIIK